MEALKKEMERKKGEREALAGGGGGAAASGPKKWMRRGDVEAARERQYREETAREAKKTHHVLEVKLDASVLDSMAAEDVQARRRQSSGGEAERFVVHVHAPQRILVSQYWTDEEQLAAEKSVWLAEWSKWLGTIDLPGLILSALHMPKEDGEHAAFDYMKSLDRDKVCESAGKPPPLCVCSIF